MCKKKVIYLEDQGKLSRRDDAFTGKAIERIESAFKKDLNRVNKGGVLWDMTSRRKTVEGSRGRITDLKILQM